MDKHIEQIKTPIKGISTSFGFFRCVSAALSLPPNAMKAAAATVFFKKSRLCVFASITNVLSWE
ncbi:MAG: hypothetical protein ACLUKN_03860 [Bacilli bacterium]